MEINGKERTGDEGYIPQRIHGNTKTADMSRTPTKVSDESVARLKQLIVEKTGLSCTSFPDIQQLQSLIKKETKEYLCIQTLNRFFGLIKNGFLPSVATLNILSRFVGYQSLRDFELLYRNSLRSPAENALLSPALLSLLFSNVNPQTLPEDGLMYIARNLHRLVENNPGAASTIYASMATCKYGRTYFFEQLVNLDALNRHYGDGLHYYLLHARKAPQQFFGYSLLCKRYLLSCQYDLFAQVYARLAAHTYADVKDFHPYLVGSYFAAQVYHSIVQQQEVAIVAEALAEFGRLPRAGVAYASFPFAEYALADALLLAGEHYLAWEVLQAGSFHRTSLPPYLDPGFVTQYDLMQLYAGYFGGIIPERKAVEQLAVISEKPFFFLSRSYFSFFLLKLKKALLSKAETRTANEQLLNLVATTGFRFFSTKPDSAGEQRVVYLMDNKGKEIV